LGQVFLCFCLFRASVIYVFPSSGYSSSSTSLLGRRVIRSLAACAGSLPS